MNHIDDEKIQAYLDQELDDAERDEIEAHLTSCSSCRAAKRQYQLLYQGLGRGAGFYLPENFSVKVMGNVNNAARSLPAGLKNLFIALFGVVVGINTVLYYFDYRAYAKTMSADWKVDMQLLDSFKTLTTLFNQGIEPFVYVILILLVLALFDRWVLNRIHPLTRLSLNNSSNRA